MQSPWYLYRHKHREPDLVLVDGRFRVACVLESLMSLSDDNPCRVLLDDYASRPEYRVVEEFADLLEMRGRMAVLRKKSNLDRKRCEQALQRYYADYR